MIGAARMSASSRSTLGLMPSDPAAFVGLSIHNCLCTPFTSITISGMVELSVSCVYSSFYVGLEKTDTN